MILIAIAWIYVVLMVAVVEATGERGTVLGAVLTLLLYGVLPLGIVMYLMLSPARRRSRKVAEAAEAQGLAAGAAGLDPDQGGHSASDPIAAERKET
ncbi:MAG: hypothetical protein H7337_06555 [Rhizobacter sp.]|nr:hypothetical protein [Rhizobacter sp.]